MVLSPAFNKKRSGLFLLLPAILIVFLTFFLYQRSKPYVKSDAGLTMRQESLGIKTTKVNATITPPAATPTTVSSRYIYFGLWTQGFWDEQSYTLHPEKLISLQNVIGKKVAIAHYYRGWENLSKQSIITELQTISNNGWRPMLSANPYFFDQCQQHEKNIYRTIADGECDNFLQNIGENLKQYGGIIFLRFAWEMNIDSIEWSVQKTGSEASDFIDAWRKFHDIIVSAGAKNVLWVWSPNVITTSSISYNRIYPGNAYVDWIGLDGYNWGKTQTWSTWQTFNQVFLQSYKDITLLAPQKPLMIAEVNTTDNGGNKATWYQDMLTTQIPYNFPKVKAVVFYNENRMKQEGVNWLIDVTASSLQSFSDSIKNPIYISSF